MNPCLSDEQLQMLLADLLSDIERQRLEPHLRACTACEQKLARLAQHADSAKWRRLQGASSGYSSMPESGAHPTPGAAETPRDALPEFVKPAPVQPPLQHAKSDSSLPQIEGYEVLSKVKEGGMGVVYKARQIGLPRVVALKMILHGDYANEEQKQRFRREAEAVARLQHSNIVQIYDIGEHHGQPYFALEFCDGGTLRARIKDGPLAPREAAQIVETLARAVDLAHQNLIVHRDLKPENVLFAADGAPKVTDFGLAGKLEGDAAPTQPGGLTCSGAILGTIGYMAPEQARGERVGPLADLFALGIILYELLTGKLPFEGTLFDFLSQVQIIEPARPRALRRSIPADLETICLKCLQKEPGGRYGSAEALAEDLRRFLAVEPIIARPVGRLERSVKWARRHPARATALTMALVATILVGVGAAITSLWLDAEHASEQAAAALISQKEAELNAEEARKGEQEAQKKADRAEAKQKLALTEQAIGQAVDQGKKIRGELHAILKKQGGVQSLVNQPAQWQAHLQTAKSELQRAKALAGSADANLDPELTSGMRQLAQNLAADEADKRLALRLEKIRLDTASVVEGKFNYAQAEREYPLAFGGAGLTLAPGRETELVGRISQSPIKDQLLAALDHWAWVAESTQPKLAAQLLALARLADPDPWRDQIRDLAVRKNLQAVEQLADAAQKDPKFQGQLSPQMLHLVGNLLQASPGKAEAWLRTAQARHPADFWINFHLAFLLCSNKENVPEGLGFLRAALAIRPDYGGAYHYLGNALRAQKDLPGAVAAYKKALAIDPKLAAAWDGLGNALFDQKDLPGAVAARKKALAIDPKSAPAWINLGNTLREQKDLPGAVAAYKKALAINPEFALALNSLGNALRDQKDLPGAMDAYKKALAIDPKFAGAWYNLGVALNDQKDLLGAVDAYKKALAIDPNFAYAWHNLGLALSDQKDLPGAVDAYKKALAIDAKLAPTWNNLGLTLGDQKDLPGAVDAYKKALAIDPNFAKAWNNLGNALSAQKDLPAAVDAYRKALAIDSKKAYSWYNLGLALHYQKDLRGAVDAYKKAVAIDAKIANAWYNLGNALSAQKDLPGAVDAYKKAVAIDAKIANAWYNLGNALREQNDLPGAVDAYKKALAIDPKFAGAWVNLGYALHNQKDLSGAADAYKKAINLNGKDAEAHYRLGLVLLDLGQFPQALKALRQGHLLGSKMPGWSNPSADWVRECERLLALDNKLPDVLQGKEASAAECIALADLCLRYKKRYGDAASLFEKAFTDQPQLAENLSTGHRYNAARAAVLAAAGKGVASDKQGDKENGRLRGQGLDWLNADLIARAKLLAQDRLAAVKIQNELQHWQNDPDLASVREEKELAQLPAGEKAAWQKLWEDFETLRQKARGSYTQTQHKGTLSAKMLEQVHDQKMTAGNSYVIDLESTQFDSYLRLENGQGKVLAENDDISADNQNSRIVFTPKETGSYRIVATSFEHRGVGGYTLTVREFAENKK